MYTKVPCPHCIRAKGLLQSLGVTDIQEIRVDLHASKMEEMLRRIPPGTRTVPQIFIGGHYVGGASELEQLNSRGELKPLLGIS